MKLLLNLVAAFALVAMPVEVMAQQPTQKEMKQNDKAAKSSAKKQAKNQTKAGWALNGSGDLETIVYKHLLQTQPYGGKCQERVGNAENMRSISLAQTKASTSVRNSFASDSRMALKMKLDGSDSMLNDEQEETLLTAYEGRVATEISGELKRSFEVIRKNENGKYDLTVYYLVDEEAAQQARLRAVKYAAELQQMKLDVMDKISKFVNED